jgi:hypothetical protein
VLQEDIASQIAPKTFSHNEKEEKPREESHRAEQEASAKAENEKHVEETVQAETKEEVVAQVEPQQNALHPPGPEPKLVEDEPEPVKHALLEPHDLAEVKEPEPEHTVVHERPSSPRVLVAPKLPNIPIVEVEEVEPKTAKFPVESAPERPAPPTEAGAVQDVKVETSATSNVKETLSEEHDKPHHPATDGAREKKGPISRAAAAVRKQCSIL